MNINPKKSGKFHDFVVMSDQMDHMTRRLFLTLLALFPFILGQERNNDDFLEFVFTRRTLMLSVFVLIVRLVPRSYIKIIVLYLNNNSNNNKIFIHEIKQMFFFLF